jgi:hypothetical protein
MFATAHQADSAAFQNSALSAENKEKKKCLRRELAEVEGYYVAQFFWFSLQYTTLS